MRQLLLSVRLQPTHVFSPHALLSTGPTNTPLQLTGICGLTKLLRHVVGLVPYMQVAYNRSINQLHP
jgi:hypothetical protein